MLELLSGKAFSDLSETEKAQLAGLEKLFPELDGDDSFEIAASAVSLTNLDVSEPMPAHLQAKILADADKYFASQETSARVQKTEEEEEYQKTFAFEPKRSSSSSWRQWLGWLVAATACIALAVNLWLTRFQPRVDIAGNPTPAITPQNLTPAQERAQLLNAVDTVQTILTNPKNPNEILGDVAWNDTEQKGFVRLRGVPVNDATKEQYQLWIFASNQDRKTPVDGGVFDVGSSDGEVIIPIDAKIKVEKPTLFAVTAEKPGGVVVSKQEKVMAIAKVET
ncbi:MAG: anti-sigma factor [Acidobacteriota bacterium]|nr:anti-sigma factor [Acidobacteriota bacterium]